MTWPERHPRLSQAVLYLGILAAWEILRNTPAVAGLIRDAKTFQIPTAIQTGSKSSRMTPFDGDAFFTSATMRRRSPPATAPPTTSRATGASSSTSRSAPTSTRAAPPNSPPSRPRPPGRRSRAGFAHKVPAGALRDAA